METFFTSILPAIVSAIVGICGTLLYHKQTKVSKDIDNISRIADEWTEMYDKAKQELAEKDNKIDELYRSIQELRQQITRLERDVSLLNARRCDKLACSERIPPIKIE